MSFLEYEDSGYSLSASSDSASSRLERSTFRPGDPAIAESETAAHVACVEMEMVVVLPEVSVAGDLDRMGLACGFDGLTVEAVRPLRESGMQPP